MDFYEALKDGATTTDLLNTFYKELEAASQKLEAERKEEEQKKATEAAKLNALEDARETLVDAVLEYAKLLSDEPLTEGFDREYLTKKFVEIENTYKTLKDFSDSFLSHYTYKNKDKDKTIKNPEIKITSKLYKQDDDGVLREFLNLL